MLTTNLTDDLAVKTEARALLASADARPVNEWGFIQIPVRLLRAVVEILERPHD